MVIVVSVIRERDCGGKERHLSDVGWALSVASRSCYVLE